MLVPLKPKTPKHPSNKAQCRSREKNEIAIITDSYNLKCHYKCYLNHLKMNGRCLSMLTQITVVIFNKFLQQSSLQNLVGCLIKLVSDAFWSLWSSELNATLRDAGTYSSEVLMSPIQHHTLPVHQIYSGQWKDESSFMWWSILICSVCLVVESWQHGLHNAILQVTNETNIPTCN